MDKIASLLDFAVCFDNLKASKPDIQNELSYVRRLAAINTISNQFERCAQTNLSFSNAVPRSPFLRLLECLQPLGCAAQCALVLRRGPQPDDQSAHPRSRRRHEEGAHQRSGDGAARQLALLRRVQPKVRLAAVHLLSITRLTFKTCRRVAGFKTSDTRCAHCER